MVVVRGTANSFQDSSQGLFWTVAVAEIVAMNIVHIQVFCSQPTGIGIGKETLLDWRE